MSNAFEQWAYYRKENITHLSTTIQIVWEVFFCMEKKRYSECCKMLYGGKRMSYGLFSINCSLFKDGAHVLYASLCAKRKRVAVLHLEMHIKHTHRLWKMSILQKANHHSSLYQPTKYWDVLSNVFFQYTKDLPPHITGCALCKVCVYGMWKK